MTTYTVKTQTFLGDIYKSAKAISVDFDTALSVYHGYIGNMTSEIFVRVINDETGEIVKEAHYVDGEIK